MSKEAKIARMRQELSRDGSDPLHDYAYLCVMVMKEMGWTVDYVMEMPILKFNTVAKILSEHYEEMSKGTNDNSIKTWKR